MFDDVAVVSIDGPRFIPTRSGAVAGTKPPGIEDGDAPAADIEDASGGPMAHRRKPAETLE